MLIQPYQVDELRFAWCYREYFRCRTRYAQPQQALLTLNQDTIASLLQEYGIHILEVSTTASDVKLLASLSPTESTSAFVSKSKGRISRWLREQLKIDQPGTLLSRGYFACTTGQSTTEAVKRYLDTQGEHHGYASRARPPVYVQQWAVTPTDEGRLHSAHAVTLLQFHVVLATWMRQGVFHQTAAESVTNHWRMLAAERQIVIEKVSFVPDHVHLAIRTHPNIAPADIVVELMNTAQDHMWHNFAESVIQARVNRLWQPSAYIGSYGDLASNRIAAYIRNWERSE